MTKKQSSLFLFLTILSILGFFALAKPGGGVIHLNSIHKDLAQEDVIQILKSEHVAFELGDDSTIKVPEDELSKTELLLTGLKAISQIGEDHSQDRIIAELAVQQYLRSKVDELMVGLVGKSAYIAEIYVSPTYSSFSMNNSLEPQNIVTYFLNTPGIKRIYFRLVVDSTVIAKKELDPDMVQSRVKRHLRVILHDLKGVRLTEEIAFVPFHGTGLGSLAMQTQTTTPEESWISQLFIPLLSAAAVAITFLIVLLLKKNKQQPVNLVKRSQNDFAKNFEGITFQEQVDDQEPYIMLDALSSETIENFTNSQDFGSLLPVIHPKEAARLLQMLPLDRQVKSIAECIEFNQVGVDERERMTEKISRKLDITKPKQTLLNRNTINHAAKILNELQAAKSKRILQELHQLDAKSLVRLKNEFYVLTTLMPLKAEEIKYIFENGEGLDLILSVCDSDSSIKEKVLDLAPKEICSKLMQDITKVDPFKVQAAQLRIVELIAEYKRKKTESRQSYQKVT